MYSGYMSFVGGVKYDEGNPKLNGKEKNDEITEIINTIDAGELFQKWVGCFLGFTEYTQFSSKTGWKYCSEK